MFRNEQLKLGRANFATHSVSHQNQNRRFDHRSRLDRRMMRNMANRASRVGAPRVMVRDIRLGSHEQQRKDAQTNK